MFVTLVQFVEYLTSKQQNIPTLNIMPTRKNDDIARAPSVDPGPLVEAGEAYSSATTRSTYSKASDHRYRYASSTYGSYRYTYTYAYTCTHRYRKFSALFFMLLVGLE